MSIFDDVAFLTTLIVAGVGLSSIRREFNTSALSSAAIGGVLPLLILALALAGASLQHAAYFGCLVFVCGLICEIDRRSLIIPDPLVAMLVLLALTAPFAPERVHQILGALLAGAIFMCVREIFYLIKREHALGLGDVKLAAAMGALLGPTTAFMAIGVAAGVTATLLLVSRKRADQALAPFGVGLSAALALTVLIQAWT